MKSKLFSVISIISCIPLLTKDPGIICYYIDIICCFLFIVDFIWKLVKGIYNTRIGLACIDIICLISYISLPGFRVIRLMRVLKLIPSQVINTIAEVIKSKWKILSTVLLFAGIYILSISIIMLQLEDEPGIITIFDSIYWAICTLTTVGYGDVVPVSSIGRCIGMLSSMVGIALIALPSGILAEGFREELDKSKK